MIRLSGHWDCFIGRKDRTLSHKSLGSIQMLIYDTDSFIETDFSIYIIDDVQNFISEEILDDYYEQLYAPDIMKNEFMHYITCYNFHHIYVDLTECQVLAHILGQNIVDTCIIITAQIATCESPFWTTRMSIHIFGVGPGVIVVILMWIFNIVLWIMCIRIRRTFVAIIAFVIEVVITLIIISWPLATSATISEKVEVSVDYVGIPRSILVIVEAVILLIFCIEYIKHDLTAVVPPSTVILD
uniref:Transmembrane protein n=1 Tax=Elaeophora elaphi TaxID=1147741 RepID=A0A0R3RXR4_9BILA